MGLIVDIYRSDYDSTANAFHGQSRVTLVNVEGPFEPAPDRPAALLIPGPQAGPEPNPIIVPDKACPADMVGPMFGGTYAASSDSRFGEAVRALLGDPDPAALNRPPFRSSSIRAAIPVHDRFEVWEGYRTPFETAAIEDQDPEAIAQRAAVGETWGEALGVDEGPGFYANVEDPS